MSTILPRAHARSRDHTRLSGVDGGVLRVSTTYDIRGLREKITSYDNATVGSGTVVNEVVYEYNDLGMPVKEYRASPPRMILPGG